MKEKKTSQIHKKMGFLCSAAHRTTSLTLLHWHCTVQHKGIELPDSLPQNEGVSTHSPLFRGLGEKDGSSFCVGGDNGSPKVHCETTLGQMCRRDPQQLRAGSLAALLAHSFSSWGFELPCAPTPAWPSCCSHASALAWEQRLTGSTDWPPLAQSNVCVHFRKQSRSWRRPESFPLQGVLTPDFCVKCHQISDAQPRTKQGQALSGGLILHPFKQISRTQAGRRGGSRPAIPELQVLGNWDVKRREKGTVKQQFWWFLSAFDVIFFSFLFCSRVLKIDSLTNAYSTSVVLNKKQHLYYCFQAFSNRYNIKQQQQQRNFNVQDNSQFCSEFQQMIYTSFLKFFRNQFKRPNLVLFIYLLVASK